MLTSSVTCDVISFFVTNKCQKKWKVDEIANIDGENLHIFWAIWLISLKFSGKMWLMIILKVTKNQGFTLSLESAFLEKPQGKGEGSSWPPSLLKVKDLSCSLLVWLLLIFALQNIQVKGQYLNCDSIKDLKIIIILFLQ